MNPDHKDNFYNERIEELTTKLFLLYYKIDKISYTFVSLLVKQCKEELTSLRQLSSIPESP